MKKILVLMPDGSNYELEKKPTLQEMQEIVGGYIEHVAILDRIENGRFIYTSMFVHEEGLLLKLPRNADATVAYQRNVRAQFPEAANPFQASREAAAKRYPAGAAVHFLPRPDGYDDDPYIAGPAILFAGYTREEVDAL